MIRRLTTISKALCATVLAGALLSPGLAFAQQRVDRPGSAQKYDAGTDSYDEGDTMRRDTDSAEERRLNRDDANERRGTDRMDRKQKTPPVSARGEARRTHVVEKGETLGTISEQYLGKPDRWKEIAKANNIDDPNALKVGMRLNIPDSDAKPASNQDRDQDRDRDRNMKRDKDGETDRNPTDVPQQRGPHTPM